MAVVKEAAGRIAVEKAVVDNKATVKLAVGKKFAENEVTENEVAENEVPENEVTENEVPENEVAENIVTDNKVGENEVAENGVAEIPWLWKGRWPRRMRRERRQWRKINREGDGREGVVYLSKEGRDIELL